VLPVPATPPQTKVPVQVSLVQIKDEEKEEKEV
jgi:hypothetical protein